MRHFIIFFTVLALTMVSLRVADYISEKKEG